MTIRSFFEGLYMANLHEIEFIEILAKLPNVKGFNVNHELCNVTDDMFRCALGFEDRCPWIAELLSENGNYKSESSFCFEYSTNITDNEKNKTRLLDAT